MNTQQEQMNKKMNEVTGADKTQNMERVANSRTVIVDNVSLDLGLTSKEIQKFFLDKLIEMGIRDVSIIDVDVNSGGVNNSVWVELVNQDMIKHFKKLDGAECLGEMLKVRCLGEETTQTNI